MGRTANSQTGAPKQAHSAASARKNFFDRARLVVHDVYRHVEHWNPVPRTKSEFRSECMMLMQLSNFKLQDRPVGRPKQQRLQEKLPTELLVFLSGGLCIEQAERFASMLEATAVVVDRKELSDSARQAEIGSAGDGAAFDDHTPFAWNGFVLVRDVAEADAAANHLRQCHLKPSWSALTRSGAIKGTAAASGNGGGDTASVWGGSAAGSFAAVLSQPFSSYGAVLRSNNVQAPSSQAPPPPSSSTPHDPAFGLAAAPAPMVSGDAATAPTPHSAGQPAPPPAPSTARPRNAEKRPPMSTLLAIARAGPPTAAPARALTAPPRRSEGDHRRWTGAAPPPRSGSGRAGTPSGERASSARDKAGGARRAGHAARKGASAHLTGRLECFLNIAPSTIFEGWKREQDFSYEGVQVWRFRGLVNPPPDSSQPGSQQLQRQVAKDGSLTIACVGLLSAASLRAFASKIRESVALMRVDPEGAGGQRVERPVQCSEDTRVRYLHSAKDYDRFDELDAKRCIAAAQSRRAVAAPAPAAREEGDGAAPSMEAAGAEVAVRRGEEGEESALEGAQRLGAFRV